MYGSEPGPSRWGNEQGPPMQPSTSAYQSHEDDVEEDNTTMELLGSDHDYSQPQAGDGSSEASVQQSKFAAQNGVAAMPPSIDSQALAGPSSASRVNAIAKLKRAASQREMKGRGGYAGDSRAQTPLEDAASTPSLSNYQHSVARDTPELETAFKQLTGNGLEGAPYLTARDASGGSKSVSPIPPGMLRVEQLRSLSNSPLASLPDRGAAANSTEGVSLLNRSRSQRGDARSPLPSLEQLRARILQERASAGLARSASTSAASAAARQYALEKLLGESPRQGAISPVSDTAEEPEAVKSNKIDDTLLSVPGNIAHRPLLRRSRTIGSLSAAAEAQRKAAFVQALDDGVPEDVKSGRRSSRRFAKAPLGGRSSISSKPSDAPILEQENLEESSKRVDEPHPATTNGGATELDRSLSQRQIARTEMMRKLSGRGKAGQKSPLSPIPPASSEADDAVQESFSQGISPAPRDLPSLADQQQTPVTPPAQQTLATLTSPSFNLLTVPGPSPHRHSPSSRASTAMTSFHEADRNRASEMARLLGEEAFEYERLLEMGFSTDDAYERVASARSGSYIEMSSNRSPRSNQGDFAPSESDLYAASEGSPTHLRSQQSQLPYTASSPESVKPKVEMSPPRHSSVASIPLGLGSRRQSGLDDEEDEAQGDAFEVLERDDDPFPTSRRRAAWPESVTSTTMSDPFTSPKGTTNASRDSEDSRASMKARPALLMPSSSTLQRIEDVLSTDFFKDFGNPLDYSISPDEPTFPSAAREAGPPSTYRGTNTEGYGNTLRRGDAAAGITGEGESSDYLREVDEMTQRLGDFARRKNSTSRSERDAAVQHSSAAQVQAAASDDARREASNVVSTPTQIPIYTSVVQEKAAAPSGGPTPSPSSPLRPLPSAQVSRATETSVEQNQYVNNGKLSPFPGLLQSATPSPETSDTACVARKPSPLSLSGTDVVLARTVNDSGQDTKGANDESGKPTTFLSTLRRKASNAASRTQGSSADSPSQQPSRKFGSLLKRRPSESKNEGSSPSTKVVELPMTPLLPITPAADIARPMDRSFGVPRLGEGSLPQTSAAHSSLAIPTSSDALHRYSRMLTSPHDAYTYSDIPGLTRHDMENPPRRFLFAAPVLQVVTASAVKDRFLFVFSDLLIIAKPIAASGGSSTLVKEDLPTLDWTFSVKEVLEVAQLKQMTMPSDERRHPTKGVALMEDFIRHFQHDPERAIDTVVTKSQLPRNAATIAQLLHQTPRLDRRQLSMYLFHNASMLRRDAGRAFIELEKCAGVSIESSLRSLLLEIRFPTQRDAFEDLLVTFSIKWIGSNRHLIKETFSEQLAVDLVFAIMALNDALHSDNHATPRMFSRSMPQWPKEEFLQAFRNKDREMVLSDRTLSRIYTSVSQEPLQQALREGEAGPRIPVCIHSPGVPTRLTFGVYSNAIRVSIPRADADFMLRLYGQDLAFQPQVLTFDKSNTQEFKVISRSLGLKSIVFVRAGRNARLYPTCAQIDNGRDFSLPRSVNVVVERAFKQHCFTLVTSLKAGPTRFTFSVDGDRRRQQCVDVLREMMASKLHTSDRATQALALHVLRESILEPDETQRPAHLQRSASASHTLRGASPRGKMIGGLSRTPSDSRAFGESSSFAVKRNQSVSKHYYHQQGKNERHLAEETPDLSTGESTELKPILGDDLILTVRQNSLLSLVVAHLRGQR